MEEEWRRRESDRGGRSGEEGAMTTGDGGGWSYEENSEW